MICKIWFGIHTNLKPSEAEGFVCLFPCMFWFPVTQVEQVINLTHAIGTQLPVRDRYYSEVGTESPPNDPQQQEGATPRGRPQSPRLEVSP